MNALDLKLIPDSRLFAALGVSKEAGRRLIADLEREKRIRPLRTATGRILLSPNEAVVFAAHDNNAQAV